MLQQQLKEATVGTKTLKAQPYLELKRIYTVSNSQSNELLLLDAFRFWLKYMLKDNVDRSSQVYFLDSNSVAVLVEVLPS